MKSQGCCTGSQWQSSAPRFKTCRHVGRNALMLTGIILRVYGTSEQPTPKWQTRELVQGLEQGTVFLPGLQRHLFLLR